ncbi:MAG: glycosyltransferase family 39 protein [Nitrospirae bacterium]|nr:glycosyltransferase family 39 protein [Nitrospirota bacterium]
MTTPVRRGTTSVYILLSIFTAAALFYNLSGRILWGDEAETALLASNVMKYGLPVSTDGRNTITLYGHTVDSNENHVWTWRPWLDEYLVAASFSVFGKSTAAARLPFAIVGFLSAVFLTRLVYKIYGSHETAIIAALCFITSELFILHARQCRYYSVVIFAQIWLILGLCHLFTGRGRRGAFHMSLALAVQFYCNYIIVIGNIVAVASAALLVRERHKKRLLRYIISGFAAFASMAAPWILYAKPWAQAGRLDSRLYIPKLHYYAVEMNFHMFPLALLIIPAVYFILRRLSGGGRHIPVEETKAQPAHKDIELFLWIVIPLQLAIISIMPGLFVRYFVPLIPVFCILQALLLTRYIKAVLPRYVLVGLLCFTNLLSIFGLYFFRYGHKPAFPVINLMRSIAVPYRGRLDDVIAFLKKEAAPNESILVFETEFPLIFYTDMQIIDGRYCSTKKMPKPDWFFPAGPSCVFDMKPDNIPDDLAKDFTPIEIEVHKSKRAGSIPEPDKYEYFTTDEKEKFVIYKRKAGTK